MSHRDDLNLLLRVSTLLNSNKQIDQVLQELLATVLQSLKAERGFVVLRDREQWVPVSSHSIETGDRLKPGTFSRSIVDQAATSGDVVVMLRSLDPEKTYSPSIQILGIHSAICAPLRWDGRVRGAVYVDNRVSAGVFKEAQRGLLQAIADQASRSLEAAALRQRLQPNRQLLSDPALDEGQAVSRCLDVLLRHLEGAEPTPAPGVPSPPSSVSVSLFGGLKLRGTPITEWKSRKDRELFCFLALQGGQLVHQEKLMEQFWPGKDFGKAKHSLQNSITQIRKVLNDDDRTLLQRQYDGYLLNPECKTDLSLFREFLSKGRREAEAGDWEQAMPPLSRAEKLAHEPLLPGWEADWLSPWKVALSQEVALCRTLLAEHFQRRGKHLLALEVWKRVLQLEPCHDEAHRGVLESYLALGKNAEADRAYQSAVEVYREELDLDPPWADWWEQKRPSA